MKYILWLFLIINSVLAQGSILDDISISETRGVFGLSPVFSQYEYRLMNPSGDFSAFKGQSYGGQLNISLFSLSAADFSFFGQFMEGNAEDKTDYKNTMKQSESTIGAQANLNQYAVAIISYSSIIQNIETSLAEIKQTFKSVNIGLGLEYQINRDYFISLQGWYRMGPISKKDNPDLMTNSSFDGVQFYLIMTWSPSLMTISEMRQ